MGKVGKGCFLPAKFKNIIKDLYENETIKYSLNVVKYTFASVTLTPAQEALLTYPIGYVPKHNYIVYQVDTFDNNKIIVSSKLVLGSFVVKDDGYIYSYYFDVTSQPRFEIKVLKHSKHIDLAIGAVFTASNYLEVFNDIGHKTVILGNETTTNTAVLGHIGHKQYFYQTLVADGVDDTTIPKTKLTGLSKSLRHLHKL